MTTFDTNTNTRAATAATAQTDAILGLAAKLVATPRAGTARAPRDPAAILAAQTRREAARQAADRLLR